MKFMLKMGSVFLSTVQAVGRGAGDPPCAVVGAGASDPPVAGLRGQSLPTSETHVEKLIPFFNIESCLDVSL